MTAAMRSGEGQNHSSLPGDRVAVGFLVSAAITALTLVVAFGLLALDVEYFWVVFVLGFGVVLPTSLGVVAVVWTDRESHDTRSAADDPRTPLDELRHQYARGEITDEEFERRVERLLETNDEEFST